MNPTSTTAMTASNLLACNTPILAHAIKQAPTEISARVDIEVQQTSNETGRSIYKPRS